MCPPWMPLREMSLPQRLCGDYWARQVDTCWGKGLITDGSGIPGAFVVTRGHCEFFIECDFAQTQTWTQQVGVLLAKGVMSFLALFT